MPKPSADLTRKRLDYLERQSRLVANRTAMDARADRNALDPRRFVYSVSFIGSDGRTYLYNAQTDRETAFRNVRDIHPASGAILTREPVTARRTFGAWQRGPRVTIYRREPASPFTFTA